MVLTLLRCDWRSRHSLNLSDAKLKPITTWSPAFSRALDSLFGFTLSSHWYLEEFFFPPNGGCDYFVVGLMTLNRKALSLVTNKASLYHTQKKIIVSRRADLESSLSTRCNTRDRDTQALILLYYKPGCEFYLPIHFGLRITDVQVIYRPESQLE